MDIRELLRLSQTSIVANKLRSILTTLGIIIGVFAVILLVSIGSGLQTYITKEITSLGSNLIFVIPGTPGGSRSPGGVVTNKLTINDAKNLELRLRGTAQVGPVIQKNVTAKFKNESDKGVAVFGTTANYPDIIKTTVDQGAFFSLGQERAGAKVVLIGQTVQSRLFGDASSIGERVYLGNERYVVLGVLKKRGAIFGIDQDNSAIIPIGAAQRQFGITNVNTIYISANNPDLVPLVKDEASKVLLKHLTTDDFTLQTQEQTLSTISNITNILSIALGGIAAISLLVGGIGVMNIMLVSVTERTKEIGLRKALGAKRSDILKQFLLEAVILTLVGGSIGIALGLAGSLIMARFFISEVTPWSIIIAFAFSVGVGIIFGITPAIRASKLSPIDALRYE